MSLLPTAALIFAGLWLAHVSHDQTIGCLRRPGQTRPVEVLYMGARFSLLEAVLRAQEEGRTRAVAIMPGDSAEPMPSRSRDEL